MTRRTFAKACYALVAIAVPLVALESTSDEAAAPLGTKELLDRAVAELTQAKALSFHAEILVDRIDATGQKLQFAGAVDAAVRRPDRFRFDYIGDLKAKRAWYDGQTLTIFDPDRDVYAKTPGAGDVAATLHSAEQRYGVTLPLVDLLRSDLEKRIDSGVVARVHRIGLHDVGGVNCHHLALRREHDDLQVWIRARDRPTLCKVVFTYKEQPGSPQYVAVFSDWDLSPTLADNEFEAVLPKQAVKASFLKEGRQAQ